MPCYGIMGYCFPMIIFIIRKQFYNRKLLNTNPREFIADK